MLLPVEETTMSLCGIGKVHIAREHDDIMPTEREKAHQFTPGRCKKRPVIEAHVPCHSLLEACEQVSHWSKGGAVQRTNAHGIFRQADQRWQEHGD